MRDLVVFPQMVAPIFVGREKTRRAIERALATDRRVLVVTQRRSADDDPQIDALYAVGVTAAVINCVKLTDGTLKLAISGLERAAVGTPVADEFLAAEIAPIAESNGQTDQAVLLSRLVLDAYRMFANVDYSHVPPRLQARLHLPDIGDPSLLADTVAPLLPVSIEQRQQLLETSDVIARLEAILELIKAAQRRRRDDPPGIRRCPVPPSWGSCRFPVRKALADAAAIGHICRQVVHSGRPMFSGRGESPHRR